MLCLKIPSTFIDLILSFFTCRTNTIITSSSIITSYHMKVDIDQGEVISPLLWCIYYDPLLVEVQSWQLGYNLSHTYRQNLYDPTSITTESINIPALAYMDDTNWISDSE